MGLRRLNVYFLTTRAFSRYWKVRSLELKGCAISTSDTLLRHLWAKAKVGTRKHRSCFRQILPGGFIQVSAFQKYWITGIRSDASTRVSVQIWPVVSVPIRNTAAPQNLDRNKHWSSSQSIARVMHSSFLCGRKTVAYYSKNKCIGVRS